MEKNIFIFFTFVLMLVEFSFLPNPNLKKESFRSEIAGIKTYSGSATISTVVGIPENQFSLFGYGSPNSLVTLEGFGLFDQTYSNSIGYFEFQNYLPFSNSEICLFYQDQLGRLSTPVCLAPPPKNLNSSIGPIILPPTISLTLPSKNTYLIGEEIILSGQSIPNTEVYLSSFIDESRRPFINILSLIKPVEAATFPLLSIKTDNKGNFSVALPSSQANFFRLFSRVNFLDEFSSKSNTLSFQIFPFWILIIKFFLFIWLIIKSRWLELLILGQIIALFIFIIRSFIKPYKIAKNRALSIKTRYPIIKQNLALKIRDQIALKEF